MLLRAATAESCGRLIAFTALTVTVAAAGLAVPGLLADAVEAAITGTGTGWPSLLLTSVIVAGTLAQAALSLVAAAVTGRGTAWVQTYATRHLLGLGLRSPLSTGEAAARIMQGGTLAAALPVMLVSASVAIAGAGVGLVALWFIDWWVGLASTAVLPAAVLLARRFVGDATTAQTSYLRSQGQIAGSLIAALRGARSIRAAGTLDPEAERVVAALPDLQAAGRSLWDLQRRVVWQLGLLLPTVTVLVLGVGGTSVASGRISPAQLVAVIGYQAIASSGLGQIDTLLEITHVRAAVARLDELTAEPLPVPGAVAAAGGPGAIAIRDVTVRRDGELILDRLSLDIPAGTSLALVGRSGAGKSVLAALVGRLVDADHGAVEVDGVDVRDLTATALRGTVAYAFERPELVGDTVRDALAYGRPELTDAAVRTAARAAHADRFIRRLPLGYDTPLAQAPLSGGERQRLGLARALVRPARVYVLDDATSGLDTITDAEVSRTVTTQLAGRTRLVVTHRASTAARCDRVAWLADGRVAACGHHSELWSDPGYRAVFAASPSPTDQSSTDGHPDNRTTDDQERVRVL